MRVAGDMMLESGTARDKETGVDMWLNTTRYLELFYQDPDSSNSKSRLQME